jgi:hypothetical protein
MLWINALTAISDQTNHNNFLKVLQSNTFKKLLVRVWAQSAVNTETPIPLGLFSFYESLVSQAKKRVGVKHLLFFLLLSLKNFTQKLTMQGQIVLKS